jgi:hypothetical protein
MDYGGPTQFIHGASLRFESALGNARRWDPCPHISEEMYTHAEQVPQYLKTMRHRLFALEPQALSLMLSVVSRILPTLFSASHREARASYLLDK